MAGVERTKDLIHRLGQGYQVDPVLLGALALIGLFVILVWAGRK